MIPSLQTGEARTVDGHHTPVGTSPFQTRRHSDVSTSSGANSPFGSGLQAASEPTPNTMTNANGNPSADTQRTLVFAHGPLPVTTTRTDPLYSLSGGLLNTYMRVRFLVCVCVCVYVFCVIPFFGGWGGGGVCVCVCVCVWTLSLSLCFVFLLVMNFVDFSSFSCCSGVISLFAISLNSMLVIVACWCVPLSLSLSLLSSPLDQSSVLSQAIRNAKQQHQGTTLQRRLR
jgi:hypothetical protein